MMNWFKRPGREQDETERPNGIASARQPTVYVTPAAREKLVEVLESKGGTQQAALRITALESPSGAVNYGMALEDSVQPAPGDTAIDLDGLRILVDAASLPHVDRATVDFLADPLRAGFKVEPPQPEMDPRVQAHAAALAAEHPALDLSNPAVAAVQSVIERQVNPGIAQHGGHATLVDVKDDVAFVQLGGGCQGCAMATVTLKQGVERMIKAAVPTIREVVDVTNHAGGANPFYQSEKGGASPFHAAAKG